MSYDNPNEFINEMFESYLSRNQIGLKTSMTGSCFIFDGANIVYCKCHEIDFKRGDLHIDSPDQIKRKKVTIKNKDDGCFQ